MMCLLNVYLVCNLATECKKDKCQKQLAYTLMQGSKVVFYQFPVLKIKTIWSYDWQVRLIQSLTVRIMPTF